MTLRLGVLGAGSWVVASHLPVLAERRADVEFAGVCRKGAEELEWVRRTWDFRMASERFEDVLDAGVDIVVVASPAATHFEHALAAIEAGAHVLVEKPFTLTSAQAWELVDAAAKRGVHLLIAFGYNYKPLIIDAGATLASHGGLGELESLSISMASVCRELLTGTGTYPKADKHTQPDSATWADPTLSGGGYIQAQLTHAVGLGLQLFDVQPESVLAVTMPNDVGTNELHCSAVVKWQRGAMGSLTGDAVHEGFNANRDILRVQAVGADGDFCLDLDADRYRYFRTDDGELGSSWPAGAGSYDCVGPPNALVDLALGATEINRSPGVLGARTVEIVEAMYASARRNEFVPVADHRNQASVTSGR